MRKSKIIKDSVHGYIDVCEPFLRVIDSAEFQRLKWIEQGSFRVLYPAARHDRFIHSLGVYHLASIFAKWFFDNIENDLNVTLEATNREKLRTTLLYAALLHDVGHSPLSHTCEHYFKVDMNGTHPKIVNDLLAVVQSAPGVCDDEKERFSTEFISSSPAPHEIVSATIMVDRACEFLSNPTCVYLELAARMVLGCTYRYRDGDNQEIHIRNCLIRLVNSPTVDIDKLDYITRDTKMSGFDNVPIDINRLARSVSAIKDGNGDWFPAFRKNALSVLDNVFKAKAEEAQWMISHPVVVYECNLLKNCIQRVAKQAPVSEENFITGFFSREALSVEGVQVGEKRYRLLSDIDVLHEFKLMEADEHIEEYFQRSKRRRAIWKSYQEYVYLFKRDHPPDALRLVWQYFKPLIEYMNTQGIFCLNSRSIELLPKEADVVSEPAAFLREFAQDENLVFDFVLLEARSSFSPQINADRIYVNFPDLPPRPIQESTFSFLKGERDGTNRAVQTEYFYLYAHEKVDGNRFVEKIDKMLRSLQTV